MKFDVIYANPAWKYLTWSEGSGKPLPTSSKAKAAPYDLMTMDDIIHLPVADIANDDCVLFLWTTGAFLELAFNVIRGWGFEYKTMAFVWVKRSQLDNGYHFGMGHWTRLNAEYVLLGTRGKPKRKNKSISQIIADETMPLPLFDDYEGDGAIITPVQEHSKKPNIVNDLIVDLVAGVTFCELFARREYPNWVTLGNAIDGKDLRVSIPELALK